jgi:hypothetical protein
LAWPAGPLRAQPVAPSLFSVCVADEGVDPQRAALLCTHVRRALPSFEGHRPIEADTILCEHSGFNPRDALQSTLALCDQARQQSAQKRHEPAALSADQCVEGLLALEPWLPSTEPLADALVLQAELSLKRKEDRWKVDQALIRLLNFNLVDPSTLRDRLGSQALRDRLDANAKQLLDNGVGGLDLQTEEPGLEVYLDGHFVGVAPLTLDNLSGGEHLLRVRKVGVIPSTTLAVVVPGEDTPTTLAPLPAHNAAPYHKALSFLPQELGAPRPGPSMEDLRSLFLAERILGVRVRANAPGQPPTLEGFLYDMRSSQLIGATLYEPQAGQRIEDSAQALLSSLQDAVALKNQETPLPQEGSWWTSWWFLGGVGVVAAGGLAAGLWLGLSDPEPPKPTTGGLELRF